MVTITVRSLDGLKNQIQAGAHTIIADEPVNAGGEDEGPDPYSLLLSALGACTSMTLHLYARQKGWPLEEVEVILTHSKEYAQDCQDCETKVGRVDEIRRRIQLKGNLSQEQRQRLIEIAAKCPVHKTLMGEIKVRDTLV
ncbi:MAG: OsmC family protein [Acidobacteria bacterium]|nr:OsmC family protein [Acidobacteriota bacterium]